MNVDGLLLFHMIRSYGKVVDYEKHRLNHSHKKNRNDRTYPARDFDIAGGLAKDIRGHSCYGKAGECERSIYDHIGKNSSCLSIAA